MNNQFLEYIFKEVIGRADKGAAWIPFFVFDLTGRELLYWQKKGPEKNPSLQSKPLSSPPIECLLLNTEHDAAGTRTGKESAINKDLYAIFATVGHLMTNFHRDGLVTVTSPALKKSIDFPLSVDALNEPFDVCEVAMDFYKILLAAANIDVSGKRNLNKTICIKIGLMPSASLH